MIRNAAVDVCVVASALLLLNTALEAQTLWYLCVLRDVISSGLPPTRCVPVGGQPCPPAHRGRLHHPPPRPRALLHPQHPGIQRFSTDVQSEKQLKTTQRQKEELLAVEHRMKSSFTQAVALPPCPTPRAPLLIKSRISSRAAPILLCVTLNLSPAHPPEHPQHPAPPGRSPAPVPALTTGTECRKMRWLCVHKGTNLIFIDFLSLLKGKTL